MSFNLFMHHIIFVLYFFCANLQSAIGFVFCFSLFLLCVLGPYSSTMPRKTRANRVPSTPSVSLPLGFSYLRTTIVMRLLRN